MTMPLLDGLNIPRPGMISCDTAERIEEFRQKVSSATSCHIQEDNIKTANKIAVIDREEKKEKDLLILRDHLSFCREATTDEFVRLEEGSISRIIKCPSLDSGNESLKISSPIVCANHLSITGFYCHQLGSLPPCIEVSWYTLTSAHTRSGFFLAGDHINAKRFWAELSRHGITVRTTVRAEKEIKEGVFSFLMRTRETRELPRTFGWCCVSKGDYIFVPRDELTYISAVLQGGGKISE